MHASYYTHNVLSGVWLCVFAAYPLHIHPVKVSLSHYITHLTSLVPGGTGPQQMTNRIIHNDGKVLACLLLL